MPSWKLHRMLERELLGSSSDVHRILDMFPGRGHRHRFPHRIQDVAMLCMIDPERAKNYLLHWLIDHIT